MEIKFKKTTKTERMKWIWNKIISFIWNNLSRLGGRENEILAYAD